MEERFEKFTNGSEGMQNLDSSHSFVESSSYIVKRDELQDDGTYKEVIVSVNFKGITYPVLTNLRGDYFIQCTHRVILLTKNQFDDYYIREI